MNQAAQSRHKREITIDSNWIMTVGMAVLLVICGALLVREIRYFIFGHVGEAELFTRDLFTKIFAIIAAVYCFLFASGVRVKSLKVAFVLVGIKLAAEVVASFFHVPARIQHFGAVVGSVALQIALAIFVISIAQWFMSVARRVPPPPSGEVNS